MANFVYYLYNNSVVSSLCIYHDNDSLYDVVSMKILLEIGKINFFYCPRFFIEVVQPGTEKKKN